MSLVKKKWSLAPAWIDSVSPATGGTFAIFAQRQARPLAVDSFCWRQTLIGSDRLLRLVYAGRPGFITPTEFFFIYEILGRMDLRDRQ